MKHLKTRNFKTFVCSTGSIISLVAGLLFGLFAAVGAYLASQNPSNVWLSLGERDYLNCCGLCTFIIKA